MESVQGPHDPNFGVKYVFSSSSKGVPSAFELHTCDCQCSILKIMLIECLLCTNYSGKHLISFVSLNPPSSNPCGICVKHHHYLCCAKELSPSKFQSLAQGHATVSGQIESNPRAGWHQISLFQGSTEQAKASHTCQPSRYQLTVLTFP